MRTQTGKVFGIGLSRTGTTSLAVALAMLGYKAIHAESVQQIELYEASTDTPVAARYRQLDKRYPHSRFILTVRDMESWLESCRKHWYSLYELSDKNLAIEYAFCRGALYGIEYFDADIFRSAYERHVDGVRAYFKDRPGDLLELNIAAGEGFEKLCPFLGKPVLEQPFPRQNIAAEVFEAGGDRSIPDFAAAATYLREGDVEWAREHLRVALTSGSPLSTDKEWFLEWVAGSAVDAKTEDPGAYIDMIFDHMPAEATAFGALRRHAHARYHAAAAFLAYQEHHGGQALRHILAAVFDDPALMMNRGLISIGVKALLPHSP